MRPTAPTPARPARAGVVRAWGLLALRPLSFLAAQALVAGALALAGAAEPWWSSAAWWPVSGTLANVVGLVALAAASRAEGLPLRAAFAPAGARAGDAATFALAVAPVVALALVVPWALGVAIWGTPAVGQAVLAQPLPTWAAWFALVAFPLSTAAVELPTYAGFVAPRVAGTRLGPVGAALVVGLVFGVQYVALPFLPARTFTLWRATMAVPMALALVAIAHRWPRLLPWFVAASAALAAAAVVPVWHASL